ncbi:4Fe-4S dicluster domain-containing protein [Xiamenia xianingshaonis]|uniref:4Fe-4S dicluster domain-containing protein n=1 Tax=Xiamenia xianingshaonis TaxID=2682776 RepID=A0ABX0IJU8_9ACTN|nr:4Fe-4S dicluster domain-containing protein [Xiamenia xianingshaonis]NHM14995.1 4Fe-4S dicluster domain-containing protein [Xiamenia xianingshaonis]
MAQKLGMVIDMKNCIGCSSCAMACKIENNLPDNMWWNRILTDGGSEEGTPSGAYPKAGEASTLAMDIFPVACQHCENPACTRVCPVGATYKDPATGAVRQDYDKCIGCRMCMSACPYTGVRSFNWEEPKFAVEFPVGDPDAPAHQKHTVEKCTLCWHRLAKGLQPACVEVCPSRVRYFGDLNDPNSEVSQLLASREYMQLLPEKGTHPSIYYLV